MIDAGAIAVKVGIEAIKRTAPAGIAWVSTYIRGATILIVGPSASGKTSFSDYLNYGILSPISHHITTTEETSSPTFAIDIGNNSTLKLRVRKTLDEPGQIGPMAHAKLVKQHRPHAIFIVLDAKKPQADINEWASEFCENLERIIHESPPVRRKIKSIIVCINKRDVLNDENEFQLIVDNLRTLLTEKLRTIIGEQKAKQIPILPCVSVLTQNYGSTLADAAIAKLAKDLD